MHPEFKNSKQLLNNSSKPSKKYFKKIKKIFGSLKNTSTFALPIKKRVSKKETSSYKKDEAKGLRFKILSSAKSLKN